MPLCIIREFGFNSSAACVQSLSAALKVIFFCIVVKDVQDTSSLSLGIGRIACS